MTDRVRRTIAMLQMAGGLVGMWLTSSLALGALPNVIAAVGLGVIGIPFFAAFWAGRLLWTSAPRSVGACTVVQLLQIPILQNGGIAYSFHAGLLIALQVGAASPLQLHLGSVLDAHLDSEARPMALGINFVAVWAVWHLSKGLRPPRPTPTQPPVTSAGDSP